MTDAAWIETTLVAARPQTVAALLRYFRDLDAAEEAFQEACLRALKHWPANGPPRDAAAWLIMVGRNSTLDALRKRSKNAPLPEEIASVEEEIDPADRLDESHYRDDILRLLFVCCHPDLPATQQIALALRIVSGVTVERLARTFLTSEAAMEQRITRAKAKVAEAGVPFGPPDAFERTRRVAAVMQMIYLIFNEGYSAEPSDEARFALAEEAIRLGRLLLRMFPAEPEAMGLMALMLLQHSRAPARFDDAGDVVLLEHQDRGLWRPNLIQEGLALIDKAMRHRQPGPYQVQAAIGALHARSATYDETDWNGIDALYGALERMQPSPVITLNRAMAVSKIKGAEIALEMVEPLADKLTGYFYFHGARGALLLQLGRRREAREAFDRAISLANTAAEAAHIRMHLDRLEASGTSS